MWSTSRRPKPWNGSSASRGNLGQIHEHDRHSSRALKCQQTNHLNTQRLVYAEAHPSYRTCFAFPSPLLLYLLERAGL